MGLRDCFWGFALSLASIFYLSLMIILFLLFSYKWPYVGENLLNIQFKKSLLKYTVMVLVHLQLF